MTHRDVWVGCPVCGKRVTFRVYRYDGRWWAECLDLRCGCKRSEKQWRGMERAGVHLGKVSKGPVTLLSVGRTWTL
jgi:hypothetical protein